MKKLDIFYGVVVVMFFKIDMTGCIFIESVIVFIELNIKSNNFSFKPKIIYMKERYK